MLAGQKLGRRHQAGLAPGFDRNGHGEKGDHRLARADIALQQAQHAGGGAQIARDFGNRLFLAIGQAIGQGRAQFFLHNTGADHRPPPGPPQLPPDEG